MNQFGLPPHLLPQQPVPPVVPGLAVVPQTAVAPPPPAATSLHQINLSQATARTPVMGVGFDATSQANLGFPNVSQPLPAPATLPIDFVVTVDAVDGGRVTEMVGVPRIEGLIGVVLAEVVGDVDDFGAGRGCETFGTPKFACDVASKPTPITGVRAVA